MAHNSGSSPADYLFLLPREIALKKLSKITTIKTGILFIKKSTKILHHIQVTTLPIRSSPVK